MIDSRQELFSFKDQIIWLETEEELLQAADSLVVSRRPIDQEALVSICLLQTNLKRIMLEKPLASSPQKAQKLLEINNTKAGVRIKQHNQLILQLKKERKF